MERTFTVELTEAEASAVWRMAELSGLPAAQIVRNLHRSPLFRAMVACSAEDGGNPNGQTAAVAWIAGDLLVQLGLVIPAEWTAPDEG